VQHHAQMSYHVDNKRQRNSRDDESNIHNRHSRKLRLSVGPYIDELTDELIARHHTTTLTTRPQKNKTSCDTIFTVDYISLWPWNQLPVCLCVFMRQSLPADEWAKLTEAKRHVDINRHPLRQVTKKGSDGQESRDCLRNPSSTLFLQGTFSP
jgi:hypothetical protein